ncbi:MAG: hypothetical protein COA47_09125 [Robiginitomaculum sp.]|nr:MAG: hypothetical protein COA47_09125 [Robiginitomaculum sp.]
MPRQNRVSPNGDIIVDPIRGRLTGNRGCLHGPDGQMTGRRWTHKAWICCLPEFKGWTRPINPPGRWTQLFFADDLVALSAGHRPCHTCRRAAYLAFQQAFGSAWPETGPKPKATQMDAILHAARLDPATRNKRVVSAELMTLPSGVFLTPPGEPQIYLWWQQTLLAWSFSGLQPVDPLPGTMVNVLTPEPVVRMLAQGYQPEFVPKL